jgi:hypothetical protein
MWTWNSRDRETVSGTDFGDRMGVEISAGIRPFQLKVSAGKAHPNKTVGGLAEDSGNSRRFASDRREDRLPPTSTAKSRIDAVPHTVLSTHAGAVFQSLAEWELGTLATDNIVRPEKERTTTTLWFYLLPWDGVSGWTISKSYDVDPPTHDEQKSLRCMRSHGCVRVSHPLRPCDRVGHAATFPVFGGWFWVNENGRFFSVWTRKRAWPSPDTPPAFFAAFRWQLGARWSLDRCDNSRAAGVRFDRSFQANPLLVAHFVAPGVAPE